MKVRIHPQVKKETKAKLKFAHKAYSAEEPFSWQKSVESLIQIGFANELVMHESKGEITMLDAWDTLTDKQRKQYFK